MSFESLAGMTLDACQAAFGENVTFTPAVGSPVQASGIFSGISTEIDSATGFPVQVKKPVIGIKLADFPQAPKQGDRFTVRSVTYKVLRVDEDGEGGAQIALAKA